MSSEVTPQELLSAFKTRKNAKEMRSYITSKNPPENPPALEEVLLRTTPEGNNCLHLSSIRGRGNEEFCKVVLELAKNPAGGQDDPVRRDLALSLLTACNKEGKTPLLTAVTCFRTSTAFCLLSVCRDLQLTEAIMKQDKYGRDALYYAIHWLQKNLVLELIKDDPELLSRVDSDNFTAIAAKFLDISNSAPREASSYTALHSAANNNNPAARIPQGAWIHTELLEVAVEGNDNGMRPLQDDLLLGTTPQGNTCLHISSILGHEELCKIVLKKARAQAPGSALAEARVQAQALAQLMVPAPAPAPALESARNMALALDQALAQAEVQVRSRVLVEDDDQDYLSRIPELAQDLARALVNARAQALVEAQNQEQALAQVLVEAQPHEQALAKALAQAVAQEVSLLTAINEDNSTPLLAAVTSSHDSIASHLLSRCRLLQLSKAIWKQDKHGRDALYYAIHLGQERLARELIQVANNPVLSEAVRPPGNYADISQKILDISGSAQWGAGTDTALRATAVRNGTSAYIGTSSISRAAEIHKDLLKAALEDNAEAMRLLASTNQGVLLGTTLQGNTCLHISSSVCCVNRRQQEFSEAVLELNPSLLFVVNSYGETPLLTAVKNDQVALATLLLDRCFASRWSVAILMQDMHGCNALHHAIRRGHTDLALRLIEAKAELSSTENKYNESPMVLAVLTNNKQVLQKLLEISFSFDSGANGTNALHAAVINGDTAIATMILEKRPWLATAEDQRAVCMDKMEMVEEFLQHNRSLGYQVTSDGIPHLCAAAYRGHVDVAQVLLRYCPDTPYCSVSVNDDQGLTNEPATSCLHQAVLRGHTEFVKFIINAPQLRSIVNMRDEDGQTALHHAVSMCNPTIVAALLRHPDIDLTVPNGDGTFATWLLYETINEATTLRWNEVLALLVQKEPERLGLTHHVGNDMKLKVNAKSKEDVRSLTKTYTSNTSIVAILIATITFAAAFTPPGGYSIKENSEGLPVMASKATFWIFMISDALAMCSALAVAFLCIIKRWHDFEFLQRYRAITKYLIWVAYIASTVAFPAGLYTILAPRVLWLAVTVCTMSLLPILAAICAVWPTLKLNFRLPRRIKSEKFRLRRTIKSEGKFKYELLDLV